MIISDIQKLEVSAVVDMFEVDLTASSPGTYLRFHSGKNGLLQNIVWQGLTYFAYPVEVDGFELVGSGTIPRPTITLANTTGLITASMNNYKILGAKVTRRRTLVKYLDAVNFPNGVNPSAAPDQHFPDEIWYVDRKVKENKIAVTFELAAPWDVQGVKLPRRQCVANTCTWKYRGPECGYTGGPVADKNDLTTSNPSLDSCGKRLVSCKLRFGEFNQLPFGGFPACGVLN